MKTFCVILNTLLYNIRIIIRIAPIYIRIFSGRINVQTFSHREITPDFEASFWWNIRTSEATYICQKLHVGHSQPERMVSNGYRWQDSRAWTYQCHVEVSGKRLKGEKPNHSSPTYLKISWKKTSWRFEAFLQRQKHVYIKAKFRKLRNLSVIRLGSLRSLGYEVIKLLLEVFAYQKRRYSEGNFIT